MQACQVCGKQNPAGVDYCEDCGAAMSGANQPTSVGSTAPTPGGTAGSPPPPSSPGSLAPSSSAEMVRSAAGDEPPPTSNLPSVPPPASGPTSAPPTPTGSGDGSGAAAAPPIPAPAPLEAAPSAPEPPAGATAQRARLVVKRFGAPTGDEIPLVGERLVVGRFDPETGPVDIDLSAAPEAQHISRQHGELYRESDGRWLVRDLGSTNGVFVQGKGATSFGPRITAPHPLENEDEIAFGNARFVFRAD